MARLIKAISHETLEGFDIAVYWEPNFAEYYVVPRRYGVCEKRTRYYKNTRYFTDDRQDALQTAARMAREFSFR